MNKLRRVVIIDDNEIDCYLYRFILERMHIADEVKIFKNAEDALLDINENYTSGKSQQARLDLFLLDLSMPRFNGFEFLDELKTLQEVDKSKFIIVMLTSSIYPPDKQKATGYGDLLKGFLEKPLQTHKLNEILNGID